MPKNGVNDIAQYLPVQQRHFEVDPHALLLVRLDNTTGCTHLLYSNPMG